MAKTDTTMFGMDFTKFGTDFTKFIPNFGATGFDTDALMDAQKKNLETFGKAGKLMADGFEELVKRQGEMIKESVEEFDTAVKGLTENGLPEFSPEKQAEVAQAAAEQVAANTRELLDMASKSGKKVFDLVSKRAADSVSEIKTAAPTAKS